MVLTLVAIVAGVALTLRPAADEPRRGETGHRDARLAALCGVGAALAFGVSLLAASVGFRARLARHQVLGLAAILAGVAVLSLLQA